MSLPETPFSLSRLNWTFYMHSRANQLSSPVCAGEEAPMLAESPRAPPELAG